MTAIFKTVIYFKSDLAGWSETYYQERDTITAAHTASDGLAVLRGALLGNTDTVEIQAVRTVNIADAAQLRLKIYPGNPGKPADITDVDMPWTGVVARFMSSSGRRRLTTIRGVPDDLIVAPFHLPVPGGAWRNAFDSFCQALKNNNWRMQVLRRTANPLKNIVDIVPNLLGRLVVHANAHGLVEGDIISTYRIKTDPPGISGRFKILPGEDADHFILPQFDIRELGFTSGQYRKLLYDYEAIVDCQLEGKGSRRVGRPFGVPRGRRRIRRR